MRHQEITINGVKHKLLPPEPQVAYEADWFMKALRDFREAARKIAPKDNPILQEEIHIHIAGAFLYGLSCRERETQ